MNMMPIIEDSKDDTRFNPSCTPWRVRPDDAGSRVGTIYNGAGGPIAVITANSAKQLLEIASIIEDGIAARDQISDANRYYADRQQREMQRGSRQR